MRIVFKRHTRLDVLLGTGIITLQSGHLYPGFETEIRVLRSRTTGMQEGERSTHILISAIHITGQAAKECASSKCVDSTCTDTINSLNSLYAGISKV